MLQASMLRIGMLQVSLKGLRKCRSQLIKNRYIQNYKINIILHLNIFSWRPPLLFTVTKEYPFLMRKANLLLPTRKITTRLQMGLYNVHSYHHHICKCNVLSAMLIFLYGFFIAKNDIRDSPKKCYSCFCGGLSRKDI